MRRAPFLGCNESKPRSSQHTRGLQRFEHQYAFLSHIRAVDYALVSFEEVMRGTQMNANAMISLQSPHGQSQINYNTDCRPTKTKAK